MFSLPALSVTEQLTLLLPALLEFTGSHPDDATPESASVSPAEAVAASLRSRGLGETLGLSDGAVLSTQNSLLSRPGFVLPATSETLPEKTLRSLPSPLVVRLVIAWLMLTRPERGHPRQ